MSEAAIARKLRKLLLLLRRGRYRKALLHGVGAAIEHEPVFRNLPVDCVVDVGANKGQFSLLAAQTWPGARIIAFEPIPDAAAKFRRVFAGDGNVTLHEVAIGPESTSARLHLSQRQDSSSLLPIGRLQETIFPGTGASGELEVEVRRLGDSVAPRMLGEHSLLKLDVQGYELEALHGCDDLLPLMQYVYAECSFVELYDGQALAGDVIGYLAERGFRELSRHNVIRLDDGSPVQADVLFGRETAG
jgi:FkbM family methyltransferase